MGPSCLGELISMVGGGLAPPSHPLSSPLVGTAASNELRSLGARPEFSFLIGY